MIAVRAPIPSDVAPLTALMNQPGVRAGTLRLPFTGEGLVHKRLFEAGPHAHPLIATYRDDVAGHAMLRQRVGRQAHVGELFLLVGDRFWGKGLGRALLGAVTDLADRWLGLRRLTLEVSANNTRAVDLYTRAGFEIEGRLRADSLNDGVLEDSYVMGRITDPAQREASE